MQFNNFLDKIFSKPSGIKVMRYLVLHKPQMTGREIARFVNVSHMQVYRVLEDLILQGIIIMRSAGRANLYELNSNNIIVKEFLEYIFYKEKSLLISLIKHKLKKIKQNVLSIVLYGSMARGTEKHNSDVDIFVVTKDKKNTGHINKILSEIDIDFIISTGNSLSSLVMHVKELKRRLYKNKLLISDISEGKLIYGKPLSELINVKKTVNKKKRKRILC
jgi:predicted nucleotidyltransferase